MFFYVNNKEYTETVLVYLVYLGELKEYVFASLQEKLPLELDLWNIANLQQHCPVFHGIYKYKLNQKLPNDLAIASTIVAESYNFEPEGGILYHFYSEGCKKVPKQERLYNKLQFQEFSVMM